MLRRVPIDDLPHDVEALRALVARQETALCEQALALEQSEQRHAAALRHAQSQQAEYDDALAERDVKIAHLNEQIALLLARRFGASSERVSEAQLGLFNEAEVLAGEADSDDVGDADDIEADTATVGAYRRGKPKRRPLPEHLTRVEIEHELPEDQRVCPEHGVALERFDEVRFEQLEVIPATAHVLSHIRGKYRCPCCTGRLVTAPMPAQPIPKSWASPGLLAFLATGKFVDALPLYRQHRQLERLGCELSRTTHGID